MRYEFKEEDALNFARFVGIATRTHGNELIFRECPYCHGKNSNKFKFAINLKTGAYNCMRASCGAKGNMLTLAKDFGFSLGDWRDEYFGLGEQKKYRTYEFHHIESKDKAVEYCKSRGISEEVCRKYEITIKSGDEEVLVIPFRDEKGTMCFVKYRHTDKEIAKAKGKEWCESNMKPILFGIPQLDYSVDTLVITEGQFDALAVATAGIPNPVSVPTGALGRTWIPKCWDLLHKFKNIVVFGDCEKGKITLVDMIRDCFKGVIKVVRQEDYKGCKDANDILQLFGADAIRNAVENAESPLVAEVKDLSEVEYVNIMEKPSIRTNISGIDEALDRKGLFYGHVYLLTGQRGDGKSTFMEQICCNAVNIGVKTFLYSGEMPNYVIRDFADTMFSGKPKRDLDTDTVQKMADWYKGKFFVYDSSVIEADEHEELLAIVEKAIMQYGCRLICLDNLMTVVEAVDNDSLYRAQSQFVGKLAKMAIRFDVAIILVAHPRKQSNTKASFGNDDVSGSADITNKVSVVMSYQRIPRKRQEVLGVDDTWREVWVTKNRLTGNLSIGDDSVPVKFDKDSRRIVGRMDRFDQTRYGWENIANDNKYADLPF